MRGIRTWIRWAKPVGAKPVGAKPTLILQNVPMMFLNLAGIVAGIITDEMQIASIRLVYVNEQTEETKTIRIVRLPGQEMIKVPKSLTVTGEVFEFDGLIDKTFSSIRAQVEFVESANSNDLAAIGASAA